MINCRRILSLLLVAAMLFALAAAGFSAQAAQGSKLIALTFDDGPSAQTERLLDGLKERDVKVTFFVVGSYAEQYPDTVRRAYLEGHEIDNHSYDHSTLTDLSAQEVTRQITRTNEILAQYGATDCLVRAPYGTSNGTVRSAVGAPLIYWSVDPLDWVYAHVETVRFNIINDAFDGAIVHLHDSHASGVDAALSAIDELKEQGYEFVTVRELFRRRGQTLVAGQEYYSRTPNGTDQGHAQAPVITADGTLVTITAQAGATIYYTVDGRDPLRYGEEYEGPLALVGGSRVRAIAAFTLNGDRSEEAELTLALSPAQAPLVTIEENGTLSFENRSPGSKVYYTLDDTVPDTGDKVYTGPVRLQPDTMVQAFCTGGGYSDSAVVRAYYSPEGHFYRDVFQGSWFVPSVDRAVSLGLLSGVGKGLYSPRTSLTRAQLVTLLYRLAGSPETELVDVFVDVPAGKYYAQAVSWAYRAGIVKGITVTKFKPKQEVTRQELAQFLAGYLEAMNIPIPEGEAKVFRDRISDWAKESVDKMTAAGILAGDERNLFWAKNSCTRAQAAQTLVLVYDLQQDAPAAGLKQEEEKEQEQDPALEAKPGEDGEQEPDPAQDPDKAGEEEPQVSGENPGEALGPTGQEESAGETGDQANGENDGDGEGQKPANDPPQEPAQVPESPAQGDQEGGSGEGNE